MRMVYRGIPTARTLARDHADVPRDAAVALAEDTIQRRYLRVSDAVRNWARTNAFSGETFGLAARPRLNRRSWNFTTAMAASEAIGLLFQLKAATSGRRSSPPRHAFGKSGLIASAVATPAMATPLSSTCCTMPSTCSCRRSTNSISPRCCGRCSDPASMLNEGSPTRTGDAARVARCCWRPSTGAEAGSVRSGRARAASGAA